ncbi:MAG: hypothetical protein ABSG96_27925, partial [Terracidiphilus sp.]
GDFALASQMGLHMAASNLQNWYENTTFTNSSSGNQLTSHIPVGTALWQMPLTSEDISWGISPHASQQSEIEPYHYIWQVTNSNATVIATGDNGLPYVATTPYGQGQFIYDAAMQPLMGYGGFAPGMYAYGIFRNAIQWAFQSANLPLAKVSPWPYQYNAAYMVRHDLEDYQDDISGIESSAQFDNSLGALGEYYFCTGTLRVEMGNSPSVIAGLQQAATLYGATIGSHDGGLPNPNNSSLIVSDFDYWHWGPDEALDDTVSGYSSGSAYASASLSQSFSDISTWMTGYEPNLKTWVAPYFNGTREGSNQILQQLGVATTGEQKLGPFPHWTLSTQTDGLRYPALTLPVSDWILPAGACGPEYCLACNQSNCVAQSMDYYDAANVDAAVNYYYSIGALINIYMHELSSDTVPAEYIQHSASETAIWPVNAVTLLGWWTNRSPVQITPSYTIANNRLILAATISGATDSRTAVEFVIPNWAVNSSTLQVLLNGSVASPSSYRTYGNGIKVSVGTTVSTVQVSYALPSAPLSVSSVTLNPSTVVSGATSTGTVTLSGVAPTGTVVTLTSGNASVATVPVSVTVPAGSTSTTFTATAGTVATSTNVSITATYVSKSSATLTVTPQLAVSSVTLNPSTVVSGATSTGTVTLNAAAPTGTVVTLTSGNTAVVTVPASVTVAAGSSSATFTATAGTVATSTNVGITATYSGSSRSATLTVTPTGTGGSPFSVIDSPASNRIASGNTMTVAAKATGSGHGLVAVVCGQDSNNYVTSCSDNAPGGSNTYLSASQASSSVNQAGTTGFCNVFYATSSNPGATSVSCSVKWGYPLSSSGEPSPGNPAGDAEMWFFELNQAIHSLDSYGAANQQLNASTTALAGAAVTTQNPDTWIISAMYLTGTAKSVATPFKIDIDPASGNTTAYYSPTSAGTYQPVITANAKGESYCSSTAAFK